MPFRIQGWEDRLIAVLQKHMAEPYVAGRSDCFVLACDTVEALTGVRPYPDVRYSTDRGALRQLQRHGFTRLRESFAAILPERQVGLSQRGDLAVLLSDRGDTLAVVYDGQAIVRVGHGIERRALGDAQMILAVG